jgi:protein involved in polysaccharide export with SLBB domain
MRVLRRRLVLLACFFLSVASFLAPSDRVYGQSSITPTADQIDMFRNLSPDQQQAVLQSLGGGGGASGLGGLSGQGGLSGTDRQNPFGLSSSDRDNLSNRLGKPSDEDEEKEPAIPVLRSDDWVVIEVDFHLPPRPAPTQQAGVPGQAGLPTSQNLQAYQAAIAAQAAGANQVPSNLPFNPNANPNSNQGSGSSANQSSEDPFAPEPLTDREIRRLKEMIELIRSKNPYQLTHDGGLILPGFAEIPLAGLTDDQATMRLRIEPAFRNIDIRLTRLPLKKTGIAALKPFGYDLFDRAPSTFAPMTNVPVPSDYVVGAGDEFTVQLYGSQNRSLRLIVQRDGRVNFPELGPINVAGQRFNDVRSSIESRVERQLIGVRASVSMGDTRTIRVFVLGEARRPGTYTISSLATMTSALYASGGIKPIGSMRRVELKRQGTLVRTLDLYDLLIHGNTTDDNKLEQGDVIFVPPVGSTVSAAGELRRPAIYEIKNESSVADLVALAGGLTPQADPVKAMLSRIDENERRVVLQVALFGTASKSEPLRNGDVLRVTRLKPTLDAGVSLQGHVFTPGNYAFKQGMHLSDVIHSVDDLQPNADLHYILVRRELPPDRHVVVLSADVGAALQSPGSAADIQLFPRDRIMVFDLASGRDHTIQPVLDELRLQGNLAQPTEVVHVDGRVKVPGEYPLESGMTIADLVRAGGGLSDAAYGGKAELTRYRVENGETRRTDLIEIDLAQALRGDAKENLKLEPFDILSIKEVSQWRSQESVTLTGEVRFPGRYDIKRGETLVSVLARAGGLTEYAFPEGSVFTREELKKREQEQMDALATRMQTDLAAMAIAGTAAGQANSANTITVGQSLLGQLRAQRAVGRLVIDLPKMMRSRAGSPYDVILRDADQLIVPRFQQQVTVIGEVQSATSHLYGPGLSRDDYINLSGGTTPRAAKGRTYVVRANGSVVAAQGHRWFSTSGSDTQIRPGDTIVVPLDTEKLPALPFWTAVTTIIYNVAIAVAAIHGL